MEKVEGKRQTFPAGGSLSDGTGNEWCLWRGCAVLPLDGDAPEHWQWHCRAGQPISQTGAKTVVLSYLYIDAIF
jgi:hypothetical protein